MGETGRRGAPQPACAPGNTALISASAALRTQSHERRGVAAPAGGTARRAAVGGGGTHLLLRGGLGHDVGAAAPGSPALNGGRSDGRRSGFGSVTSADGSALASMKLCACGESFAFFSAKLKCLLACTVQVQKSYCAMGQRLLQRPSYGCLYKGSASYARRRNRSPSAAHRTSIFHSVIHSQLVGP